MSLLRDLAVKKWTAPQKLEIILLECSLVLIKSFIPSPNDRIGIIAFQPLW